MHTTPSPTFWSRLPQVSCCLEGENGILFNPDTRREKVINATGLILWNAMDGTRDTGALAAHLAAACDTAPADEILADTESFAQDLQLLGFIAIRSLVTPSALPTEDWPIASDGPRSVDLSLTGKCNLHCEYCFYADEMTGRSDLSASQWKTFFSELKAIGVRNVTLSGGEVFMRRDLWELLDELIDSRISYSMLTNGTLITEKTLEQFALGKRRSRLTSIQISIDGSCSEVHDASRGAGSFEKAVRGLRLLKEADFPLTVRMTINRCNVNDIEDTAAFLIETIGLASFSCNEAIALGTGCTRREEMTLTTAEKVKAMLTLERLGQRYPGRIQATAGPQVNLVRFRDMERAKATGWRPGHWRMGSLTACGCAYGKLAVHHDGTIAPCNMLSIEIGKIGQDRISDIWKYHPILKQLRGRSAITLHTLPECRGCEWIELCNGSCPSTAFSRTRSLISANLDDCYRAFLKDIPDVTREAVFAWKGEAR